MTNNNSNWSYVPIGEVAPAKSNNKFKPEDIVWNLSLDEIEPETGHVIKKSRCMFKELRSAKCSFDKRHVLYSKLRPYLNKVVVPDSPGVGTSELIPLMPDKKHLDREYLAYYLRSPIFLNFANKNTRGANLPRIAMKEFWKHKLPLPDNLVEQRRIVSRIKECMNRINDIDDLHNQTNSEFSVLSGEILREKFHHITESSVNIKDCTHRIGGGTPSRKISSYWNGNIPWFTVADLEDIDNILNLSISRESISEEGLSKSSAKLIPKGAVVFSSRVVVGKVGIAMNDLATNQDFCSFIPNNDIDAEYLAYYLINAKHELRNNQRGTTIKGVTTKILDSLFIPKPSIDKQRKIVACIKRCMVSLEEIKNLRMEKQKKYSTIRNLILNKAFSGEL